MASSINTTGANPWSVTLNPVSIPPVVPDYMISSGFAVFGGTPMKFINGSDTIFNVFSFFQLPVPNPCTYGNVSGKVYIDNNSDCAFNTGDVALQSIPVTAAVNFSSGSNSQNAYTTSNGNYSMQIQQSWMTNYNVSIPTNYQFIFPSTFCSPTSYSFTTLPQTNADFSLQCSSQIDVQSAVSGPGFVRPAIAFMLHPYVSNTGCDTASGELTLVKDANTVYNASLSANPATYVNGDTLKWNFTNLTNLSNGAYWNSFMAGVHLTPNTTVNIGDTLCFTVLSTVLTNDVNPANNQYSICIPVVNSYDPNMKEVAPKGTGVAGNIPLTTDHLDYTIHFQNVGTAPAINVSVIDTLDSDVDPASFRILGTSHAMSPQWLTSNVVKFNFNNIMLPDSANQPALSQGQVRFSVKLKSGLTVGTQIKNKAQIYFDTNPAIVTNTTLNTLAVPSGVSLVQDQRTIQLYPNPAEDELMISLSALSKETTSISIYSINGQLLKEATLTGLSQKIDIRDLNAGLYFVKISSGNQSDTIKFVKQ
ncbi:hypothetical protein EMGBS15_02330 [Filimonas sp.]|nr:hypothetical protein EMGBS15_02330 [Filimonas sp.]